MFIESMDGKFYDDNTSAQLINEIEEKVLDNLYLLNKPYKYMVNVMVSQRVGAGFTNQVTAFWDINFDNAYNFYYPKEKIPGLGKDKQAIFGLLTIFMISYSKLS